MRIRKWTGVRAFGRPFAAAVLAGVALSAVCADAEEFCSSSVQIEEEEMMSPDVLLKKYYNKRAERYSDWEMLIREKCRVGDVISAGESGIRDRLCDMHQPVDEHLCFLAPPRKTN